MAEEISAGDTVSRAPGKAQIGITQEDLFNDLLDFENMRTRKIITRLKKMLSHYAILELRMCNVGSVGEQEEENGPVFAQKLANLLRCRVKVYLEPVNPYGWSSRKERKKILPENFGRRAGYEIYAPQP